MSAVEISITDGVDAGKTFVISKMPLIKGDRWANRVALALCKSGIDAGGLISADKNGKPVFNGLMDIGRVSSVVLKAVGGIEEVVAQSLLDELLEYMKVKVSGGSVRELIVETDISSIDTLWKLRIACIKANLDFLLAGVTR